MLRISAAMLLGTLVLGACSSPQSKAEEADEAQHEANEKAARASEEAKITFLCSALIGLASAIAVEAFIIRFGWLREWFPTIPQLVITAVNPGTVLTAIYAGYSMWLVRRYNSTRAGALGLFTCFLGGFLVLTVVGTYFRGPNWQFFWSPADWPLH